MHSKLSAVVRIHAMLPAFIPSLAMHSEGIHSLDSEVEHTYIRAVLGFGAPLESLQCVV